MQIDERGPLRFALDMQVERNEQQGILKISQSAYIESILTEYNNADIG